jgi:hypothetical protein
MMMTKKKEKKNVEKYKEEWKIKNRAERKKIISTSLCSRKKQAAGLKWIRGQMG